VQTGRYRCPRKHTESPPKIADGNETTRKCRCHFGIISARYPQKALTLRNLILDVAAAKPGFAEQEESLKWGGPAFALAASRNGSTIRVARKKSSPARCSREYSNLTAIGPLFF